MTISKEARKQVMDLIQVAMNGRYGENQVRRSDDREMLIKVPQPNGPPIYVEVLLKLPT